MSEFQLRVKKWNDHNFPNKLPHQPLLGVVEECCGELGEAMESGPQEMDDFNDALGDTLIYLADYCSQVGEDLDKCCQTFTPKPWDSQDATSPFTGLSIYCGALCHAHLKMEQKIRSNEKHLQNRRRAVGGVIYHLSRLNSDLMNVAFYVLAQVEMRDWVRYPETGFPPIWTKEDVQKMTGESQ